MELLTIKDVCKILKISRWSLAKIIEDGEMSFTMVGKSYRFKQEDVKEYIEKNTTNKKEK